MTNVNTHIWEDLQTPNRINPKTHIQAYQSQEIFLKVTQKKVTYHIICRQEGSR